MSPDQLTFDNPVERHSHIKPHASWQPLPGLDAELDPKADHGETSYRGTGRLPGRKALITGGDSGIGAAVAIAFAREGADVALSYLPEEQVDAEAIAEHVRAAGRTAVLLPGDIRDREFCRSLVADAVEGLGGLDILVNNAAHQVYHQTLRRAGRGRPGPHDPDEPVRDVLDHARRAAAPRARARPSSTARRCRGTTRRR